MKAIALISLPALPLLAACVGKHPKPPVLNCPAPPSVTISETPEPPRPDWDATWLDITEYTIKTQDALRACNLDKQIIKEAIQDDR